MDFLPENISEYAERHTSDESPLLKEIDRITNQKVLMPRMLSGHLQGRLLSLISRLKGPSRVLEIGTYTGYSALCLAEGLADGGRIVTIDINEELEDMVRGFFAKSDFESNIDFLIGNALEIVPELNESFDLVFIDADKENYPRYYDMVMPVLNKGGLIIADNVLWSGKVIDEGEKDDPDTAGLVKFNDQVQNDDRVENVLLPVRDGLMVLQKK